MNPNDTTPGSTLPPPYVAAAPSTEPRPPLRRSRDDRIVGGVAGGLARTFGVDPVVFRVIFAGLTIIGGSGVVLYALLWLLVPEDGSDGASVADRWVLGRRWSTSTVVLLALAGAIGLSLLVGLDPGALVLLAVIAVVAVFFVRRDQRPPKPPAPVMYGPAAPYPTQPYPSQPNPTQPNPTQPYPTQPYVAPAYPTQAYPTQPYGAQQYSAPAYPMEASPPEPPKPPRERSALGVLTLGVAALAAGVLVAARLINDDGEPSATTMLATVTLILGLGLLVGTFVGRARWLVIPGVILLLMTATSGVVDSIDSLDGPRGSRTFTPQTAAEVQGSYEWGVGEIVLDLTEVADNPNLVVAIDLGVGSLRVVVPDDAVVKGTADVGIGEIVTSDGSMYDGFDNHADLADPTANRELPESTQTITLDLQVGLGEVVVSRA